MAGSVTGDHPLGLEHAAELEDPKAKAAADGRRRHAEDRADLVAGEAVVVDELDCTSLLAGQGLERRADLLSHDRTLRFFVGAVRRGPIVGEVERGPGRGTTAAAAQLVDAEVAADRQYPSRDAGFAPVVLIGISPDAHERFLDGFFGIWFGAEHAQGEGEALAMEAVIEGAERGLTSRRDSRDDLGVLGQSIVRHDVPISTPERDQLIRLASWARPV